MMWRRVWVVLHCILYFAWALGEGGGNAPAYACGHFVPEKYKYVYQIDI